LQGIHGSRAKIEVEVGLPGIKPYSFDGDEMFTQLVYDRLDDRYSPSKATYAQIQYAVMAYGSPLGPIYLGIGWSDERSPIYFLRLGSVFGPRALGAQ